MGKKFNILCLALLWSPSALCLKIASRELPPITIVSLSMAIASIALMISCFIYKAHIPKINNRFILQTLLLGALCNGIPFTLQSLAAPYLDSTYLGIMNSLIPMITFIGCCTITPSKSPFSSKKLIGLMICIFGSTVLLFSITPEKSTSFYFKGMAFAALSSIFYSAGLIFANSIKLNKSLIYPTMHVTSTLLYLPIIALFIEGPINILNISSSTIISILILSLPATALAFVFYYKILKEGDAVSLSSVNYVLPVFKVGLGVLALGEAITTNFAISSVIILLGVTMIA